MLSSVSIFDEARAACYIGMTVEFLLKCRNHPLADIGPDFEFVPNSDEVVYQAADLDEWLSQNVQAANLL